ncbi:MAG: 50S ribosomal protein L30 [Treponemataceae bacterium]
MAKLKQLKIKLIRSTISQKPKKVATVRALGLKKINSTVIKEANPCILGMVSSISHLVEVEEVK